jgi:hypothetical protein
MAINRKAWIERIGHVVLLSDMLTKKIAEKSVGSVPKELRQTIESIPFKIEEARKLRLNYATVQELSEDVDFAVPSLKERYFSKCPRREWLRVNAAFVFDYCQAGLLDVGLAPYHRRAGKKLTSAITIEWKHMMEFPPSGVFEKSPLLHILRENRIEYPHTQEEEIRSRTALVLKHAPEIIESIQNALNENEDEATIFTQPYSSHEKKGQDVMHDVVTLCELLGVETRTEPQKPRIITPKVIPARIVAFNLRAL